VFDKDGWRSCRIGYRWTRQCGWEEKFRPRSERLTFTELASESWSAADRDIDAALAASEISG